MAGCTCARWRKKSWTTANQRKRCSTTSVAPATLFRPRTAPRVCAVIADNAKVDKEALENIDGAKGVFEAQGQLQIIFGTGTVNRSTTSSLRSAASRLPPRPRSRRPRQQQNIFMRAIKVLGDVFVPIIPAIVASGLLLGIMSALNFMASNGFIALDTNNFIYKIADWSRERPLAFCRS